MPPAIFVSVTNHLCCSSATLLMKRKHFRNLNSSLLICCNFCASPYSHVAFPWQTVKLYDHYNAFNSHIVGRSINFSGTNRKYEHGIYELNAYLHEGLLCKCHPRNLIVICMTIMNVTNIKLWELSLCITRLLNVKVCWIRINEGVFFLIWMEWLFLMVLPS